MKSFINSWKILMKELGFLEILDGFFASLFYSLFITLPAIIIYVSIITMFYHLLTYWVILIMLVSLGISMLQLLMWKKSILAKNNNISININLLMIKVFFIYSVFIITIGLLFIFIFIPMMQI